MEEFEIGLASLPQKMMNILSNIIFDTRRGEEMKNGR